MDQLNRKGISEIALAGDVTTGFLSGFAEFAAIAALHRDSR